MSDSEIFLVESSISCQWIHLKQRIALDKARTKRFEGLRVIHWRTVDLAHNKRRLCSEDKIIPLQLQLLGIQRSMLCDFANDYRFANWPGLQDEGGSAVGGNYLAILEFARACIVQRVGWRCKSPML